MNPVIPLAMFDFVPNLAFLIGAYFLVRTAYLARGKTCGSVLIVGAALILLGGLLQAIWKLLYATGAANISLLSNLQFVLMAPGFVLLLLAVILLAWQSKKKSSAPLLAIAPWKLPLLIVMVLASLAAQGLLAYISIRRRAFAAGAGFILAFLCLLAMGGMSGAEQTLAQQWMEEGINAFGQIAFAAASFLLYRNYQTHGC